jgi:hypothetical protein
MTVSRKASHNSDGAILTRGVVHRHPVTVLGESSGDGGSNTA